MGNADGLNRSQQSANKQRWSNASPTSSPTQRGCNEYTPPPALKSILKSESRWNLDADYSGWGTTEQLLSPCFSLLPSPSSSSSSSSPSPLSMKRSVSFCLDGMSHDDDHYHHDITASRWQSMASGKEHGGTDDAIMKAPRRKDSRSAVDFETVNDRLLGWTSS